MKINTYDVAVMFDELFTLLGDVAATCKYVSNAGSPTDKDCPLSVIAYATYAAYDKLETCRNEFMRACGFTDPIRKVENEQLSMSFTAMKGGGSDG